jgi:hypothetical protein
MTDTERLNFLVYYKRQLELIIGKLDKQIEKMGGKDQADDKDPLQQEKDLTDPEFIRNFVKYEGLIDVFNDLRKFLQSISAEEEQKDNMLYYSNPDHGKRFAMVVLNPAHLNLYFAPRLGIYDSIPPDVQLEVKSGKSQGDRWDKFQLTSVRQLTKIMPFLRQHLTGRMASVEGV